MRTSVNLCHSDLPRLLSACEKSGKSCSKLICKCLNKYFAGHPVRLKCSMITNLVEYQPDGAGYKIVNVDLDVDTYNLAVNFRSFCRISVSMMVTIAINDYLDEVVDEIDKDSVKHNYVWYYHNLINKETYPVPQWQILWCVKRKREKKQLLPGNKLQTFG